MTASAPPSPYYLELSRVQFGKDNAIDCFDTTGIDIAFINFIRLNTIDGISRDSFAPLIEIGSVQMAP